MAFALTFVVAVAFGLFGLVVALLRRQVRERDQATVLLRQAQEAVEGRLRIRTAGLVDSNEQLRHEIATRAHAEDDLRLRVDGYRAFLATTATIAWQASAAGEFETEQPEWEAFTGQTLDESRGQRWLNAVHPDDRDAASRAGGAARSAGREYATEYRLRHADGSYRPMSVRGVPILNADGTVREWVGTHTDLAADRPGESDQTASLEWLAFQLESLPLACLLSDPAHRYTYWNAAAERLFGFARADVVGKHPFDLMFPASSRTVAESTFARLALGDFDANGLLENVTKGGREIVCEWHNTPLFDTEGAFQGVIALVQDVTARERLGEQLRQAQKMDAIGQLAGGVAHDFNNLLTIINGYTRLLADACPEGTPAGELLAEVRAASDRATDLTRQLLAFGRLQLLRPQVLNVNGLLNEFQKVIAKLVGDKVRVVLTLAPKVGLVSADPDQIEQVLTSLCVYARQAMPGGGRLTLATDEVTLAAGPAESPAGLPPGKYVRLTIADTGYGMTDNVKTQLFEPFFSTQGVGRGNGLGLAPAFGIVKQSGGHITADSTLGTGTTFTVLLPVTAEAAWTRRPEPVARQLPPSGETILLVEDERPVRALAALTLRGSGYTVLEAASGEEAIEVFKTSGPIDLLLTDVVMPGMNGRELADALRELEPELRLMYMSGYTDDARVRHGVAADHAEFLQKPFEVDDLLLKVRQVLDTVVRPRREEPELVVS